MLSATMVNKSLFSVFLIFLCPFMTYLFLTLILRKLRDPFNNPGLLMKTVYSSMRRRLAEPKLTHDLAAAVHPTLKV